jgi:uncharacterized membrane protein YhdT
MECLFFNHMVGIKTSGKQTSILCHNGTIFDKPREKVEFVLLSKCMFFWVVFPSIYGFWLRLRHLQAFSCILQRLWSVKKSVIHIYDWLIVGWLNPAENVVCVVDHWFVLLCFSFGHCIICPSIYSVNCIWKSLERWIRTKTSFLSRLQRAYSISKPKKELFNCREVDLSILYS